MISIALKGNITKKFPESTLDAFSLCKYKTFYNEAKKDVRADIKDLSVQFNTDIPKNITTLLFAEMLPEEQKQQFVKKHTNFTKKKEDINNGK